MDKLIRISILLNQKGWTVRHSEFKITKETPKTFQLEDMTNDFRDKRSLKKEKLGQISTNVREMHSYFQYHCWCHLDEVEYNEKRVREYIISKFQQVWREVNLIDKFIEL